MCVYKCPKGIGPIHFPKSPKTRLLKSLFSAVYTYKSSKRYQCIHCFCFFVLNRVNYVYRPAHSRNLIKNMFFPASFETTFLFVGENLPSNSTCTARGEHILFITTLECTGR